MHFQRVSWDGILHACPCSTHDCFAQGEFWRAIREISCAHWPNRNIRDCRYDCEILSRPAPLQHVWARGRSGPAYEFIGNCTCCTPKALLGGMHFWGIHSPARNCCHCWPRFLAAMLAEDCGVLSSRRHMWRCIFAKVLYS